MINFFKKTEKLEYIAGFLLKQEDGIAYIFTIDHTKKVVSLLEQRSFRYTGGWDNLIYDVDGILFGVENDHAVRITQSIYFVYSHLVDRETGELKQTYLDSLKAVVKENNLESLGYFELDELLSRAYFELEQTQLNAVFVEVDTSAVSAYIYQAGKRTFAESVARTQDIVTDLEEIFSHVDDTLKLPPRIIIYDSSSVETHADALLVHKWKKNMFIQLPKVDMVKEQELMQALDNGLRERIFGQDGQTQILAQPHMEESSLHSESAHAAQKEEKHAAATQAAGSVMGFMVGADVASGAAGIVGESAGSSEELVTDASDHFYPRHDEPTRKTPSSSEEMSDHFVPQSSTQSGVYPDKKNSIMQSISSITSKLNLDFMKGKTLLVAVILGLIALLAGGSYAVLYFQHKADITLFYDSKPIEKKMSFSDELNIEEVKQAFEVSASLPTTGTRDIGEKAKGEVTIYNADDESKTFEKGTKLTSSDGIAFVLNDAVTAEAASKTITDEGDVLTSTSKTQASVTAVEIGPKSNVKKDIKLKIESLPETTYFARTTKAFTGGTEKQIKTASKDDIAQLDSEIEKQIQEKSKRFLSDASDRNIIESLTSIDKTKESYSKEVAEEADSIDADVTADVTFYSYDDASVKMKIAEEFEGEAPDGYTIESAGIEYTIASAEKDEDSGDVQIIIEAMAYPRLEVDTQKFIQDIKGNTFDSLNGSVKETYNAEKFEAEINTPLPFLRSRLPYFARNITVQLKPIQSN